MGSPSKKERRLANQAAREAVRLAIANLGLIPPEKKNQNDTTDNANPEQSRPKPVRDTFFELITVGALWGFWQFSMTGPFNFFGNRHFILIPGIIGTCLVIIFGALKMVFRYKRHWLILVAGVSFCLIIISSAAAFIAEDKLEGTIQNIEALKDRAILRSIGRLRNRAVEPRSIPGTEVTQKELLDTFPFGYAIIYTTENKRFRYEVFKTGKLDWTLDWDNVKIEPDFSKGVVTLYNTPSLDKRKRTFPH